MIIPGVNEVTESFVMTLLHPVCIMFIGAQGCINNVSSPVVAVMLSRLLRQTQTQEQTKVSANLDALTCEHILSPFSACSFNLQRTKSNV